MLWIIEQDAARVNSEPTKVESTSACFIPVERRGRRDPLSPLKHSCRRKSQVASFPRWAVVLLPMAIGAERQRVVDRIVAAVCEPNLVMNLEVRRAVGYASEWCRLLATFAFTTRSKQHFSDDVSVSCKNNNVGSSLFRLSLCLREPSAAGSRTHGKSIADRQIEGRWLEFGGPPCLDFLNQTRLALGPTVRSPALTCRATNERVVGDFEHTPLKARWIQSGIVESVSGGWLYVPGVRLPRGVGRPSLCLVPGPRSKGRGAIAENVFVQSEPHVFFFKR